METKIKILFESKIQPIGNAKNPSFYIKVDKKLVSSGQLNLMSNYKVELEFLSDIKMTTIDCDKVVNDEQTQKQDEPENL